MSEYVELADDQKSVNEDTREDTSTTSTESSGPTASTISSSELESEVSLENLISEEHPMRVDKGGTCHTGTHCGGCFALRLGGMCLFIAMLALFAFWSSRRVPDININKCKSTFEHFIAAGRNSNATGWMDGAGRGKTIAAAAVAFYRDKDFKKASKVANLFGYVVCQDVNTSSIVWSPATQGDGGPLLALRQKNPKHEHLRPVVLQVPHVLFDSNTRHQGEMLFKQGLGEALLISGNHRCISSIPSKCTGHSTVCKDPNKAFVISDEAHNTDTVYWEFSRTIDIDLFPSSLVVAIHGMSHAGMVIGDGSFGNSTKKSAT